MADDPNKRHNDGWYVSSQPHEYSYFKKTMQDEFPRKSHEQVADAIHNAGKKSLLQKAEKNCKSVFGRNCVR